MASQTASYIKLLDGTCTFRDVVNVRYDMGKNIGLGMYLATAHTNKQGQYGECEENFNDIYHTTLEKCLINYDRDTVILMQKKKGVYKPLEFNDDKYTFNNEEEVHRLFFHALRINIIRSFNYSYVKERSGEDVEKLLIPISIDSSNHMDGFQMLEHVRKYFINHKIFGGTEKAGDLARDIIWMILNGHSFRYVEEQLGIKGVAYKASLIQNYLKSIYIKDIAINNNLNIDDYEYDESSGLWLEKKKESKIIL